MTDYSILPEHMREAAERWIENGIYPGSFLTAVIHNDLVEAVGRADFINRNRLHDIVSFFYNEAPSPCWGSPALAKAWHEKFFSKVAV
jgi:hypothetical protein